MPKKRTIAVVTGARSEYGILKPLLKKIQQSRNLDLSLHVAGMHLLKKYGSTVNLVKADGFRIQKRIPMYQESTREGSAGTGLSKGIAGFTKAFMSNRPDMLLVFGDRLEALAATLAASLLNIPIGHIHSGDKTDSGHIDESARHSIARYSHVHFAPTKAAAARLRKMGEQAFRIQHVGTLAIDGILTAPRISKHALCGALGLDAMQEIIAALFLPLPNESERMGAHAREVFAAIKALKKQAIIVYPNNDAGSGAIIHEIEKIKHVPHVRVVKNLPSEQYINLLRHADVLVGNSSSGIIEAPIFKLPVVNVGMRNVGREHGRNIIFVDPERNKIIKTIIKALYDKKFRARAAKSKNPYGKGGTSRAIVNFIKRVPLDKKLITKRITY